MVELYVNYFSGDFYVGEFENLAAAEKYYTTHRDRYSDYRGAKYGYPYATPIYIEMETCTKTKTSTQELEAIEKKKRYTFTITEGEDTRDFSKLWIVKIKETLSKEEYIKLNKALKAIGGYYSRFKRGFIFRYDPSEKLHELT